MSGQHAMFYETGGMIWQARRPWEERKMMNARPKCFRQAENRNGPHATAQYAGSISPLIVFQLDDSNTEEKHRFAQNVCMTQLGSSLFLLYLHSLGDVPPVAALDALAWLTRPHNLTTASSTIPGGRRNCQTLSTRQQPCVLWPKHNIC